MSLHIVSIPIGHPDDVTLRAINTLKSSDLIIGEERKVAVRFLKSIGLSDFKLELLNEHSDSQDLDFLEDQCLHKKVSLISDCGTPVFCDPGSQLIDRCRKKNISLVAIPGASSLMTLLSLSSKAIKEFHFHGFLPANNEKRQGFLQALAKEKQASVLMDTPYRLKKTLTELAKFIPHRESLLGINLTQENEYVLEGTLKEIVQRFSQKETSTERALPDKAEFIIFLYTIEKNHSQSKQRPQIKHRSRR